jgi:L-amino acid N-acyltransferase YncA
MPEVTIRDAVPTDAEAVAAIYAPYVTDSVVTFEEVPPTADEMGRRMRECAATYAWLVAEVDGRTAGYAYAHPLAARAAYRWSCEPSIYLDREQRGRGLGRALYSALLQRLTERGFRRAFTAITLPNPASERLHATMGFTLAGVWREVGWKAGAWHDVAHWQLSLGSADDPPLEPR